MSPRRLLSAGLLALALAGLLSGVTNFAESVRYTYQCIRYGQLHRLFSALLVLKLGWAAFVMSVLAFVLNRPTLRQWLDPRDNPQPTAPLRRPVAEGARKEREPAPTRAKEPQPHAEKRGPNEDQRTQEADALREAAEAAKKRAEQQQRAAEEEVARTRAAQLAAESAKAKARAERIAAREKQKADEQAAERKRAVENQRRVRLEELLKAIGLDYSPDLTMKDVKRTRLALLRCATTAQREGKPGAPDPTLLWFKVRDLELELEKLLPRG